MSYTASFAQPEGQQDRQKENRFGELRVGAADEETIIYDRGNHRAWLQSSQAVSVEAMR